MGQRGSRVSPTVISGSDDASPDLTERLSLVAPSAAVVGAGVAGVHVAYELAKLGFKVTVFERFSDIAGGETRHSLPFVGAGLIEPAFSRTAFRREALRGVLFPAACPNLIVREHLFNTLLNPVLYRWIRGRLRSCLSEAEVREYTGNLSRLSHSVVCDLVKQFPNLQEHVFSGPVTVLNERREATTTAHAEPLMVDPVGWTRALADVCRQHYDVQFALGERLENTITSLKYDIESTSSVCVSKPDPSQPEQRLFASERYDVVVLAAGASTGTITLLNSRLPVLGLSGLSAVIQKPSGALENALKSLFRHKPSESTPAGDSTSSGNSAEQSQARSAPVTLALLHSSCSLYGYTLPGAFSHTTNIDDEANRKSGAIASINKSTMFSTPQEIVLQGLLSLDSTIKTKSQVLVTHQVNRLESYLRVKCGLSVPLSASSTSTEAEHRSNIVQVNEYLRAFTPDGVPIVDHNGGAFNCFVCCGFGDHAMDFAPGAAKVLGKLVEHRAQRLREEDIEKVKAWGLVASKMSPSRRTEVEEELQMLFNGLNPEAVKAQLSSPAKDAPKKPLLRFEDNPYSTNRFVDMVHKSVDMRVTPSILNYFYDLEDAFLTRLEPLRRRFHAKATDLALRENMPDWLRTVVFCYLYEEDNSPQAREEREEHMRNLQMVILQNESPATDSTEMSDDVEKSLVTAADLSKRKQAELERRAREIFRKTE